MIVLKDKVFTCPIDVTLGLIDGKWKILIMAYLERFPQKGFSEIRDSLPKVSEKMLDQQLKQLEKDQLIAKTVLSAKPYRVEYHLTERGNSLSPLFQFLSQWGLHYLKVNGVEYLQDQDIMCNRVDLKKPEASVE